MAKRRRNHNIFLQSAGENARKGASLVMVICVSALLMAFALAMVYTASLMMARANRRLEQERCYQLAKSFAEVLDVELKKYTTPVAAGSEGQLSFYNYACKFLEGDYGEYDPDHPEETVFHYTAGTSSGSPDANYGDIRVILFKEANQDPDAEIVLEGEMRNSPEEISDREGASLQRYIFTVEVIATLNGVSYHYSTEYRQNVTYEVEYSHNGTPIFWNETDNKWHTTSVDGTEYSLSPEDTIHYRYMTDSNKIKTCKFEHAYKAVSGDDTSGEGDTP